MNKSPSYSFPCLSEHDFQVEVLYHSRERFGSDWLGVRSKVGDFFRQVLKLQNKLHKQNVSDSR